MKFRRYNVFRDLRFWNFQLVWVSFPVKVPLGVNIRQPLINYTFLAINETNPINSEKSQTSLKVQLASNSSLMLFSNQYKALRQWLFIQLSSKSHLPSHSPFRFVSLGHMVVASYGSKYHLIILKFQTFPGLWLTLILGNNLIWPDRPRVFIVMLESVVST